MAAALWRMTKSDVTFDVDDDGRRVELGEPGQFGTMYAGHHGGEACAIKEVRGVVGDAKREAAFWGELEKLINLPHKHIVRTYGGFIDKRYACIVMERCVSTLGDALGAASEWQKLEWLAQASRWRRGVV